MILVRKNFLKQDWDVKVVLKERSEGFPQVRSGRARIKADTRICCYTKSAFIKFTCYEKTFKNKKEGTEMAEAKKSCNVTTELGRKMRL